MRLPAVPGETLNELTINLSQLPGEYQSISSPSQYRSDAYQITAVADSAPSTNISDLKFQMNNNSQT